MGISLQTMAMLMQPVLKRRLDYHAIGRVFDSSVYAYTDIHEMAFQSKIPIIGTRIINYVYSYVDADEFQLSEYA